MIYPLRFGKQLHGSGPWVEHRVCAVIKAEYHAVNAIEKEMD